MSKPLFVHLDGVFVGQTAIRAVDAQGSTSWKDAALRAARRAFGPEPAGKVYDVERGISRMGGAVYVYSVDAQDRCTLIRCPTTHVAESELARIESPDVVHKGLCPQRMADHEARTEMKLRGWKVILVRHPMVKPVVRIYPGRRFGRPKPKRKP